MLRISIVLYFIILLLYIFFSRQPDYFDSELTTATIHLTENGIAKAYFTVNNHLISIDATAKHYKNGDKVIVIYENATPQKGKIYSWWNYWINIKELILSSLLFFVTFFAAKSITKNTSTESIIKHTPLERKRKYD